MLSCLWCWSNGKKQAFVRITEHKREALIKRQQQLSHQCSARYEKEQVSVQRAAELGVKHSEWGAERCGCRASIGLTAISHA